MGTLINDLLLLHDDITVEIDFQNKRVQRVLKANRAIAENQDYHQFCVLFCEEENLDENSGKKLELFLNNLTPSKDPFSLVVSFNKKMADETTKIARYCLKGLLNDDNNLIILLSKVDQSSSDTLDSVTKVYSRELIIEKTKLEIQKEQPFALVILDVDNFKQFNDSYGHMFGDIILVETASAIKKILGPNDLIGRIGGDEFLLVVHTPNNSFDEIHKVCSNIKTTIQELSYHNIKQATITVTLGCSVFPKDGNNYETLFKKADKALYRGKRKGRNCFIIYTYDKCGRVDDFSLKESFSDIENIDKNATDAQVIVAVYEILARNNAIEKNINDALSLVGNFFLIERIHLYINTLIYEKNVHFEWLDPQVKQYANLIKPEMEPLFLFNEQFDQTGMIKFNQVKKQHKDHPFIQLLLEQHTTSILCFHLIYMNKEIGIIRFDTLTTNKFWQMPDVSALMVISKIIGITIHKLNEQAAFEHYLYYDQLTGCYNYTKFRNDTELRLNKKHIPYSILYFSYHNFIQLTNIYGAEFGDYLIQTLSESIQKNSYNGIYCREAADRFILFVDNTLPQNMVTIFTQVQKEINDKFKAYNNIFIHCGIYCSYSNESLSCSVDKAKNALQYADRNNYIFFNQDIQQDYMLQNDIKTHMHTALANNDIELNFKLVTDEENQKIVGIKATSIWHLQENKILYPKDYIPIFRQTSFIEKFELYIYQKICLFVKQHVNQLKSIKVTLPIASYTINFLEQLETIRKENQVDSSYIQLEVNDNVENFEAISEFITQAQNLNYSVSLSHFKNKETALSTFIQMKWNRIHIYNSPDKMITYERENASSLSQKAFIEDVLKTIGYQSVCNYSISVPLTIEELLKHI